MLCPANLLGYFRAIRLALPARTVLLASRSLSLRMLLKP